ncbi:phosphate-starvation-inducible PsiE family protein [Microbispora siamensis]
MNDDPPARDPRFGDHPSVVRYARTNLDVRLLKVLAAAEHVILYVVSAVLLAIAGGIVIMLFAMVVRGGVGWTEKVVVVIEDLLLVLIVLEIFATVLTHLEGGRLRLEPFIIVGVIAVVRHIMSVVVRLTVSMTAAESREQFTEMAVYAGVAFLLTVALALARWSQWKVQRDPDPELGPVQGDEAG